MGVKFEIKEPENMKFIGTLYELKYNDLTLAEMEFAKEIKDASIREKKGRFIIPEIVRRVLYLCDGLGLRSFEARLEKWCQVVKISNLQHRGIQPYDGMIQCDMYGRRNIKYTDEGGCDRIAHIDPFLIIYCDCGPKQEYQKKAVVKDAEPF